MSLLLRDDLIDELAETVSLRLTNVTNGFLGFPSNATFTILDDDAPSVSFTAAQLPVFEDEGVAVVHVVLSKPFYQVVEVDYSAFGGSAVPGVLGDYLPTNGRLSFPSNTTDRFFFVNLVNDATAEPDKTIRLTLSGISGALPGPHVEADLLLYDDDGAPRLLSPNLATNGTFRATARCRTNQVFWLDYSPKLTNGAVWNAVEKFTNVTGLLEVTDPGSTNSASRFYRTRLP